MNVIKSYLIIVLLFLLVGFHNKITKKNTLSTTPTLHFQTDSTYLFKAKPKEGFNFDYYLYLPKGFNRSNSSTILIESTNSGLHNSIEHHRKQAYFAASKSSVGNYVSNQLSIPLLVPIFPRFEKNWKMYTHAFDSETFTEKGTLLERLDLQLIAMFNDAKSSLQADKFKIKDQFFMTGFSASGTFANRFSILHPEKIAAVCAGGVNGILILPLEELNGERLNFPIGINKVEEVTHEQVRLASFRTLPQFWFMGELDNNDATKFDDGYNPTERKLVYKLLGKEMMPERWEKVQKIYQENHVTASFKTYKGIGHGTDLNINNEVSTFFKKYL